MSTTLQRLLAGMAAAVFMTGSMAMAGATDGGEAASATAYQRLYLQSDSGDYLWWSFAPHEEGADRQLITRQCPSQSGLPGAKPCLSGRSGTDRTSSLWFHPRSRVAEQVTWGTQEPLRFRFALDVDTPVPEYGVHLVFLGPSGVVASEPATQVEPGVWEGTLDAPGLINERSYPVFGMQVRSPGEHAATLRLRVDGESWIELPQPTPGWSARDLRRQSPLAPAPRTFSTPRRTLWFADDDWEVVSIEGSLAQTQTLTHTTDRPAAAVLGWVEAFDPVTYTAVREGEAHPDRVTEAPRLRLLRNGGEVDTGGNPGTIAGGRGTDAVAATHLDAGEIGLEVAATEAGQQSTYTAYLLIVYGPRSLERMQVAFTPAHSVRQPAMRAVVVANCPTVSEPVPLTSAATSVRLRLDWDSANPTTKWAPRYTLGTADYPCSEAGTGSEATFVMPAPGVFPFGATPAYDAAFVSYRDTVILADVRIFYAPAGVE